MVEGPFEGLPGPLPTGQPKPGAELVAHPRERKGEVYRGGRFDGKPEHTHRTPGASAIGVPANLHGDVGTGRASASVEDDPTTVQNSREGWRDRFSDRLRHMERLGAKASAETPPQSATGPFRWASQGLRSGTETD